MTREDIIRMAREAGFVIDEASRQHQPKCIGFTHYLIDDELSRFVALVAAAEREAKNELLGALQDLLMDTQHAEHKCSDKSCPVAHAREVALKYDARGQA